MTDLAPTPRRRSCSLCHRQEIVHALHLASIWIDGAAARACDDCRATKIFYCQRCGAEQGGRPVRVGRLWFCRSCSAEPGADVIIGGPPPTAG